MRTLQANNSKKIFLKDLFDIYTLPKAINLNRKHALVTGGAGFLGSWLCDALVHLNVHLFVIDNYSSGSSDNIRHLRKSENFEFIKTDIENFNKISNHNFDIVIHLASRASYDDYQIHPIETLKVNSLGTLKALEIANEHNSIFLLTSTSEIYGDPEIIPTPESYWGKVNPLGTRSPYDESKRFSESLCKAFERKHDLDVRIVRIFNTYGPRLRSDSPYGRALSKFITQAIKGEDITVYGDGSQTRAFCYITDTIHGFLNVLLNESAKGQVFNIGSPEEITILELANKIRDMTSSNSAIKFQTLPQDDPKRRCPDISKAKKILNWSPKINLEDGLKKTIDWFSDH